MPRSFLVKKRTPEDDSQLIKPRCNDLPVLIPGKDFTVQIALLRVRHIILNVRNLTLTLTYLL